MVQTQTSKPGNRADRIRRRGQHANFAMLLGSCGGGGNVEIDVALVDDRRAGIDEDRVGREGVGAEVLVELGGRSVEDLVETLEANEGHGEGLLGDGCVDGAALDAVER